MGRRVGRDALTGLSGLALFGDWGWQLLVQGDDVHVDAERAGLAQHLSYIRAATGQLLPPAALARTDHDLGDLMIPGEVGDGPRGVVAFQVVPAGADVRR